MHVTMGLKTAILLTINSITEKQSGHSFIYLFSKNVQPQFEHSTSYTALQIHARHP